MPVLGKIHLLGPVAQRIEQDGSNVKVGGSNPPRVARYHSIPCFASTILNGTAAGYRMVSEQYEILLRLYTSQYV